MINRFFVSVITLQFYLLIVIPLYAQDISPVKDDSSAVAQLEKSNSSDSGSLLDTPQIEWDISFDKIFWSIVLLLLTMIIIKYVTRLIEKIGERWSNLRMIIKGLLPILRISTWTFVIYFIISAIIAPPIETLIAVTASAGIAVGFASQDILKNIFCPKTINCQIK